MELTLNLRDNYEFEDEENSAGLVQDNWMWELNKYGWARHFKIKAAATVRLAWPKGAKFNPSFISAVLNGRPKSFPQCPVK